MTEEKNMFLYAAVGIVAIVAIVALLSPGSATISSQENLVGDAKTLTLRHSVTTGPIIKCTYQDGDYGDYHTTWRDLEKEGPCPKTHDLGGIIYTLHSQQEFIALEKGYSKGLSRWPR